MTAKPAGIGKVLYEGQDIRLVVNDLGSDAVLLTYTARPEKGRPQGAFAKPFADKRGISGVYIVSKWAHWWQTPELPIVEAMIEETGLIRKAPHSLGYGGSMGGFGVLLSAARLGCKYGLVSGPQITFAPEVVDYPNRYAPDTDPLTFVEPDARAGISPDCRYVVLYDPLDSFDRRQVALLEPFPSVAYLRVPLASHSPLKLLNEAGVLEGLIMESLRGQADIKALHQRLRREKRDCPLYLTTLAGLASKGGRRLKLAAWAAQRAFDLDPVSPAPFRLLARLLRETGNYAAAEKAARAHMAAAPDDIAGPEQLLTALYSQAKLEEAVEIGHQVCHQHPERFELWKWLFATLTRLHRLPEVAQECDAIFARFSNDVRYLRSYADVLIQLGWADTRGIAAQLAAQGDVSDEDRSRIDRLGVAA